ncbi:MAG: P1 family peptidase [Roseobacter sp.]
MRPGPRNLITDVPGVLVGNTQNAELKSGVTVLTADSPFVASYHVMGGAPGTRDTDLLAPDKSVAQVDALVLSGGSAFGLDACSGATEGLQAQGRGFAVGAVKVPIVPGAILFDLLNGGNKDWAKNPYSALGRQAFDAAGTDFELGSFGAGTGATTAALKGGLGSVSWTLDSGITVGALVAANPVGSVTTPGNKHFYAAPFETQAEFGGMGPDPIAGFSGLEQSKMIEHANTTIAIVATDAVLDKSQCHRMAIAAHDGMARAIVPSHTPMDGDLVFALSTQTQALTDPLSELAQIGHAASICLARAIARAIYAATPAPGDLMPTYHTVNAR